MTMTRNLGDTLHREDGVRVNQINPGWVLTETERQRKKDHGLADEEITGRHVARQGEWSDAVVLFSMGLTRAGRGRMGRNIMADTFLDHLLVILSEMHAQNPGRTVASFYAQTERPTGAIGRLLARLNFKQTDMKTGDGFNLWEAEVQIPTLPVQR